MEDQQVVIQVTHPEQRSEIGGVNKFVVYTLKGSDKKGLIDINRRYSDFTLLRQTMLKRWPGCYIPSLPQKKTIGNNETLFIQSRRRGLEQFLNTVSKSPVLWESEQVQIFMRNNTDSQRVLGPLLKEGFEKLIARYQSIFPKIQEANIGKNSESKIPEFSSYLKDSKTVLEKLTEMVDKMHETSKRNLQKKLIFLQFLLPDYQRNCLLENDEKQKNESLLFLNSKTNGITEAVQKLKTSNEYPPILIILEEIKRQKRQIEAFQELMKIREDYEAHMQKAKGKVKDLQIEMSKINSGKQSLILKIKMKNKEELLALNAADLQRANQELENYTYICRIINNLMATQEIDKFKHIRQKAYFNLLKRFATEERALAEAEKDIWVCVGRHDWINLEEENNLLGIIRKDVNEYGGNLEVIGEDETEIQQSEHKDKREKGRDQQIL